MKPLVAEQRNAQRGLARLLARDIAGTWTLINLEDLPSTLPGWQMAMFGLIRRYGAASATLAARFYLAERAANGVPGRFTVPVAAPPSTDHMAASLSYATSGLWGVGSDKPTALTVINGVAQRLTVNAGRRTVLNAVGADRKARGWSRETAGDCCEFCAMLAGRGFVYRSESTAEFEAHDHCSCVAVPGF